MEADVVVLPDPPTFVADSMAISSPLQLHNPCTFPIVFKIRTNQKDALSMQTTHDFIKGGDTLDIAMKIVQKMSENATIKLEVNFAAVSEDELLKRDFKILDSKDKLKKKIIQFKKLPSQPTIIPSPKPVQKSQILPHSNQLPPAQSIHKSVSIPSPILQKPSQSQSSHSPIKSEIKVQQPQPQPQPQPQKQERSMDMYFQSIREGSNDFASGLSPVVQQSQSEQTDYEREIQTIMQRIAQQQGEITKLQATSKQLQSISREGDAFSLTVVLISMLLSYLAAAALKSLL